MDCSVVEEKGKRRRGKGDGWGLVEPGLVLIFSGTATCHSDHRPLYMVVNVSLGGNRNDCAVKFCHTYKWGLKTPAIQVMGQWKTFSVCIVTGSPEIE